MAKGGLAKALTLAGLRRGDDVRFADEVRLGLRGQTRRVLAPRGIKVVQPRQVEYAWRYLLLAVEPRTGTLVWAWIDRMRQEQLRPVLAQWQPRAVVWDGASAHRGTQLRDLPLERVVLPPYSPELNPAERIFEEVRRQTEGRVYPSLSAKQAAADAYLRELAAAPARVTPLGGWAGLLAALDALPGRPP